MRRRQSTRVARSGQRARQGFISLLKILPAILRIHGPAALGNARRFGTLLRMRFMPEEAFQLGLFSPALRAHDIKRYLSKSALKHLQERLNPESWAITVEDKVLFYRLCRELNILTPELYAVVYRSLPGWTREGTVPGRASAWVEYLRKGLPAPAVLKPGWGVYGREVRILSRAGGHFIDHAGETWTPQRLVEKMFDDPADRGWILQEQLRNHDLLRRLSGSESLQTFRIITLAGADGTSILHGHLKIIVGNKAIDNNERGLHGNLQAQVDCARGTLGPGVILRTDGRGMERHTNHPTTNQVIEGLSIPGWTQLCSFTLKVAEEFRPLQTVGWDVALTPRGPRIVEGNAWYDPPPVGQGEEIASLARALHKERKETR